MFTFSLISRRKRSQLLYRVARRTTSSWRLKVLRPIRRLDLVTLMMRAPDNRKPREPTPACPPHWALKQRVRGKAEVSEIRYFGRPCDQGWKSLRSRSTGGAEPREGGSTSLPKNFSIGGHPVILRGRQFSRGGDGGSGYMASGHHAATTRVLADITQRQLPTRQVIRYRPRVRNLQTAPSLLRRRFSDENDFFFYSRGGLARQRLLSYFRFSDENEFFHSR
ncbi:unnamed protein product, partial [Pylaiella littoralis]